jgi:activator of HSP90 ATPase
MKNTSDTAIHLHSQTRRQLLTGMAVTVGALATGTALFAEPLRQNMQHNVPSKPENEHRTALHQEVEIKATSQQIYDELLDEKKFAKLTGAPAIIDPKAGGSFSMFGGLIVGRNVELIVNQRIVQAWRPTHWSPGVYSIVKFEFKQIGSMTTVTLDHTGFPEGEFDHLDWGWTNHYWEPLKKLFA